MGGIPHVRRMRNRRKKMSGKRLRKITRLVKMGKMSTFEAPAPDGRNKEFEVELVDLSEAHQLYSDYVDLLNNRRSTRHDELIKKYRRDEAKKAVDNEAIIQHLDSTREIPKLDFKEFAERWSNKSISERNSEILKFKKYLE